jgi:hypothetical protein
MSWEIARVDQPGIATSNQRVARVYKQDLSGVAETVEKAEKGVMALMGVAQLSPRPAVLEEVKFLFLPVMNHRRFHRKWYHRPFRPPAEHDM